MCHVRRRDVARPVRRDTNPISVQRRRMARAGWQTRGNAWQTHCSASVFVRVSEKPLSSHEVVRGQQTLAVADIEVLTVSHMYDGRQAGVHQPQ